MLRALHILLLISLLAGLPATALDRPSVIGALPFDRGEQAVWAATGAPDTEGGVIWGLSSLADVAARLRLSYGTGQHMGGFGATASAVLRVRIAEIAGWHVGLVSEPGAYVHSGAQQWAPYVKAGTPRETALLGVDLGLPALMASSWLTPAVHVAVGLAVPVRVHLGPEPTLEIPALLKIAAESPIDSTWSGVAGADIGTSFFGPGAGAPTAEMTWRLRLGVAWRQ